MILKLYGPRHIETLCFFDKEDIAKTKKCYAQAGEQNREKKRPAAYNVICSILHHYWARQPRLSTGIFWAGSGFLSSLTWPEPANDNLTDGNQGGRGGAVAVCSANGVANPQADVGAFCIPTRSTPRSVPITSYRVETNTRQTFPSFPFWLGEGGDRGVGGKARILQPRAYYLSPTPPGMDELNGSDDCHCVL